MKPSQKKVFDAVQEFIKTLSSHEINSERQAVLAPLIEYIQSKLIQQESIRLNFICTHNSRRSHLSQVWAQVMAAHYHIQNVHCYSGGTEATALYPAAAKALEESGLKLYPLSIEKNPVYALKFAAGAHPIIGFSKTFDHPFNPKTSFAAIMTCAHADVNCPFIPEAEKRISVTYEDPKTYDGTPEQDEKYSERNRQIAAEMSYVFAKIKQII